MTVGLSYILFRSLQVFIDARDPKFEVPSPLTFINYTCSFLTLVSGPIQRFEEFQAQQAKLAGFTLDRTTVEGAVSRIATGLVRLTVLSSIPQAIYLLKPLPDGTVLGKTVPAAVVLVVGAVAMLAYAVYLYQNFAGYMDVVIGLGRLVGFQLPENFDRPLAATNFLDFWTRWHITLSDWFKFYLFNPFVALLMHRDPNPKKTPYYGVAGFFVAFLIIGIWHGSTPIFVVYGFLLGLGVSVNKLWQVLMRKKLGKKSYRALCERTDYTIACHAFSFGYFSFALACFWLTWARVTAYTDAYGALGVASTLIVTTLLAAAWLALWRGLRSGARLLPIDRLRSVRSHGVWYGATSLKLIVGGLFLAAQFGDAPAFVYQDF